MCRAKGAWRPALNISTVLASIGLLLADPNPEDGLMTEVVSINCTMLDIRLLMTPHQLPYQ